MEAFVFIYLGFSFFTFSELRWCPKLIIVQILVIMVGRFIAVVGLLKVISCCYDSKLSLKQQVFIWFAGMIRGAIAFGLVLKIDKNMFANADIIVTTTLVLVIFTTVVFGCVLGLLQNCLFGKDKDDDDAYQAQPAAVNEAAHEEQMLHPSNAAEESKKIDEGCADSLKDLDKNFLKPFFIYNYSPAMAADADRFDAEVIRKRRESEIRDLLGDALQKSFKSKSALM